MLKALKEGQKIALVSDSGTPGISDPGYHLINLAIDNNIPPHLSLLIHLILCVGQVFPSPRVCDKFVGKAIKRTPDFPRNPPNGCSKDCTGGR